MEPVSRSKRHSEACIAEANRLIVVAKEAQAANDPATAEQFLRQSLSKIREACVWEPTITAYHTFLHRVGRTVHDAFGCSMPFHDDHYWVNCPVLLFHNAHPAEGAQEYSLEKSELLQILPDEDRQAFAYGTTQVYCHHCTECDGAAGEAHKPRYFSG